jgi:hypothetical protein
MLMRAAITLVSARDRVAKWNLGEGREEARNTQDKQRSG